MAFARLFPIDAADAQDDDRTSSELSFSDGTSCGSSARTKSLRRRSPARRAQEQYAAAVATSRESHRFSHEDRPQLSVALRMLRLRTIYRAENIGNVLKRVVNVCQREFVKVLGPLVTEFVCNFGRENARPIQHAFPGGLLDPM